MTTRRDRVGEAGSAAAEMMLVLPVLLIMIVGLRHTGAMLLADQHATVAARTAGWKNSLFSDAGFLSFQDTGMRLCRQGRPAQRFGSSATISCTRDRSSRGATLRRRFTREARSAASTYAPRDAANLVRVFDGAGKGPGFRYARVDSRYASADFSWAQARWRSEFAVDVNPIWQLRQLSDGYDDVLRRKLRNRTDRDLFGRAFPKR